MKKLINLLRGYVEWQITGPFPERVLNLCAQARLPFWRLRWVDGETFTFRTPLSRARQVEKLARRALCEGTVLARRGAGAAALTLAARWGFLLGLAVCIGAAGFLSRFLLVVEVTGNDTVPDAVILSELSRLGVRPGAYGPAIREGEVANAALLDLPQLAYMAVNIHGTRAEITVREAVKQPELLAEDVPTDVVAAADGIILDLRVDAGRALVQEGDIVAAGDTLITGVMELQGPEYSNVDLGSLVVHAAGSVRARTWRTLSEAIPLTALKKTGTGAEIVLRSLKILWFQVDFFQNSSISWASYDRIAETRGFSLAGRELPAALTTVTLREYTLEPAPIDRDEAQTRLEAVLRARLDALMAAREGKVLRTDVLARVEGDVLTVTLLAECEEELARTVELPGETGRIP